MRFCYFSLWIKADVRLLLCMVSTVTYSTSPYQRFLQDSGCCWSQIEALIPNFSLPGEMLQTLPSLPLATLEYTFENEAVKTIFMNSLVFLAVSKSCWEHTSVWLDFPFGTFFQSKQLSELPRMWSVPLELQGWLCWCFWEGGYWVLGWCGVFLFVLNHTLDLCLIGLHLELTHPFPVSPQPSTEDRAK